MRLNSCELKLSFMSVIETSKWMLKLNRNTYYIARVCNRLKVTLIRATPTSDCFILRRHNGFLKYILCQPPDCCCYNEGVDGVENCVYDELRGPEASLGN